MIESAPSFSAVFFEVFEILRRQGPGNRFGAEKAPLLTEAVTLIGEAACR